MPRWEPMHPELVQAVRILDAEAMSYAELWRMLRPVATRLGTPWPSYWRVRRTAARARRLERERRERIERLLTDMARGVVPRI